MKTVFTVQIICFNGWCTSPHLAPIPAGNIPSDPCAGGLIHSGFKLLKETKILL
jgi:hypothetical protein